MLKWLFKAIYLLRHKVYISGKITGLDDYEKKFSIAEKQLFNLGFLRIVNPVKISKRLSKRLGKQLDKIEYEKFLKEDIKELCDCNIVFFLENWTDSNGSQIEYYIAEKLNIEKIFSYDEIKIYLKRG